MSLNRLQLVEQPVFKAMTRPPTICGITYSYWAIMLLVSMGGIVVLKSFIWFFGLLILFYLIGRLIVRYDIFLIEIIIIKLSECPRQRNNSYWGCNSYEPW